MCSSRSSLRTSCERQRQQREREGATRWPLTLYIGVFKSYPSCSGVMERERERLRRGEGSSIAYKIKREEEAKVLNAEKEEEKESNHKCALAAEISVAHTTHQTCAFPASPLFLDTRQTNKKQDPLFFLFLTSSLQATTTLGNTRRGRNKSKGIYQQSASHIVPTYESSAIRSDPR